MQVFGHGLKGRRDGFARHPDKRAKRQPPWRPVQDQGRKRFMEGSRGGRRKGRQQEGWKKDRPAKTSNVDVKSHGDRSPGGRFVQEKGKERGAGLWGHPEMEEYGGQKDTTGRKREEAANWGVQQGRRIGRKKKRKQQQEQQQQQQQQGEQQQPLMQDNYQTEEIERNDRMDYQNHHYEEDKGEEAGGKNAGGTITERFIKFRDSFRRPKHLYSYQNFYSGPEDRRDPGEDYPYLKVVAPKEVHQTSMLEGYRFGQERTEEEQEEYQQHQQQQEDEEKGVDYGSELELDHARRHSNVYFQPVVVSSLPARPKRLVQNQEVRLGNQNYMYYQQRQQLQPPEVEFTPSESDPYADFGSSSYVETSGGGPRIDNLDFSPVVPPSAYAYRTPAPYHGLPPPTATPSTSSLSPTPRTGGGPTRPYSSFRKEKLTGFSPEAPAAPSRDYDLPFLNDGAKRNVRRPDSFRPSPTSKEKDPPVGYVHYPTTIAPYYVALPGPAPTAYPFSQSLVTRQEEEYGLDQQQQQQYHHHHREAGRLPFLDVQQPSAEASPFSRGGSSSGGRRVPKSYFSQPEAYPGHYEADRYAGHSFNSFGHTLHDHQKEEEEEEVEVGRQKQYNNRFSRDPYASGLAAGPPQQQQPQYHTTAVPKFLPTPVTPYPDQFQDPEAPRYFHYQGTPAPTTPRSGRGRGGQHPDEATPAPALYTSQFSPFGRHYPNRQKEEEEEEAEEDEERGDEAEEENERFPPKLPPYRSPGPNYSLFSVTPSPYGVAYAQQQQRRRAVTAPSAYEGAGAPGYANEVGDIDFGYSYSPVTERTDTSFLRIVPSPDLSPHEHTAAAFGQPEEEEEEEEEERRVMRRAKKRYNRQYAKTFKRSHKRRPDPYELPEQRASPIGMTI